VQVGAVGGEYEDDAVSSGERHLVEQLERIGFWPDHPGSSADEVDVLDY